MSFNVFTIVGGEWAILLLPSVFPQKDVELTSFLRGPTQALYLMKL